MSDLPSSIEARMRPIYEAHDCMLTNAIERHGYTRPQLAALLREIYEDMWAVAQSACDANFPDNETGTQREYAAHVIAQGTMARFLDNVLEPRLYQDSMP